MDSLRVGTFVGPPPDKPLLRGVLHLVAFAGAVPAVAWLVAAAPSTRAAALAAVYGASLLALLGVSALYHRRAWSPAAWPRIQRLDHATIFLKIAGTYTPICLLGVGGDRGALLLAAIWLGALAGIAQTLAWPSAPRALHVALYVVIGWAGAFGLAGERAHAGLITACMHVFGGALYTVGAVVYARRRPDPWPRVFGFHEVFHAFVVVACACLYDVVRRCVLAG